MERLSGLDASFLYMETRTMPMQVAFVVICDAKDTPGGYSYRRIYDLLDAETQKQSAYRRRLLEVPFRFHHPLWIDDPDFNIMDHIHHVALPGTGDDKRELGRMVARVLSKPLDRSRPLWEAWIVEGLKDERFAVVMKFHHAAVDGVSGTKLISQLFDNEPKIRDTSGIIRSQGEPMPSDREIFEYAVRSRYKSPRSFMQLVSDTFDGVRSVLSQRELDADAGIRRSGPMVAPRTHFNGDITAKRDATLLSLSLSEIKDVKNALNVTVNDVVLAICGGAIREYLLKQDDLPEETLVSMVPMSVRKEDEATEVNNHVSGMWSTLATHIDDPLERIKLIHEDTENSKQEHDTVGADLMQDWAEYNTPLAFNLAMRMFAASGLRDVMGPVHNTIISNVPGPRTPLYLAGSKIEGIYPLGPIMGGVGLNISLASYEDTVNFAIHVDGGQVENVQEIGDQIVPAFEKLKEIAGLGKKKNPAKKKAKAKKAKATKATDEKKSQDKAEPEKVQQAIEPDTKSAEV